MDNISVLQLGYRDWNQLFDVPANIHVLHLEELTRLPEKAFDLVFLERNPSPEEAELLHKCTKAYCLFVLGGLRMNDDLTYLYHCKKGRILAIGDVASFLTKEARNYFAKPYGEKFQLQSMEISRDFLGKVSWSGGHHVSFEGDFGKAFSQLICWRNNVPIEANQALDLWFEFQKDSSVELELVVTKFAEGTVATVEEEYVFNEEQIHSMMTINNGDKRGILFISVRAKGIGKLQVVALHDRYSRRGHGAFLPGGERFVASNREELFCYFDPGDLMPPLNVYFSGYRTLEGFEGYNMMRSFGAPFLLIAEPRLEGGGFYMGNEEYETMIVDAIEKYMDELGFEADQVTMSGLSMGTYGALYYGCNIKPHAMILGKPLASIGDVANNERLTRPGGFPTSVDVLLTQCQNTDYPAVKQLNERFWNKFDQSDWSKSKFIISYMIEDDYDKTAYETLISHLHSEGVQVYGKGLHGRHNDNTGGIVNWFIDQYKKVLAEDFGREMDE